MKPIHIGPPGHERPAMMPSDGRGRDMSDISGDARSDEAGGKPAGIDLSSAPVLDGERVGPCAGRVGKLFCTGSNDADPAAESGMAPGVGLGQTPAPGYRKGGARVTPGIAGLGTPARTERAAT